MTYLKKKISRNQLSYTINGGSRRARNNCKVLMLLMAAKLGWAGAVENSECKMVDVGRKIGGVLVGSSMVDVGSFTRPLTNG